MQAPFFSEIMGLVFRNELRYPGTFIVNPGVSLILSQNIGCAVDPASAHFNGIRTVGKKLSLWLEDLDAANGNSKFRFMPL
jgi:hypothetical protein